jgi:hypothetical protein
MAVGAVAEVDGMADTAVDTAATDAAADTRHYLVLPAERVRHGEVVRAAVKQVGGGALEAAASTSVRDRANRSPGPGRTAW